MLCRLTVVLATFAAVSGNYNLRGGSEGVHRFIFNDNQNGEKKSKLIRSFGRAVGTLVNQTEIGKIKLKRGATLRPRIPWRNYLIRWRKKTLRVGVLERPRREQRKEDKSKRKREKGIGRQRRESRGIAPKWVKTREVLKGTQLNHEPLFSSAWF